MTLDKTYRPAEVEAKHYQLWETTGAFAADAASSRHPFTIMMPPPNITGSLHMGHALTFTLQDIVVRFMRMRGRDALWQPGTDHAGIATQMVVERQLEAMGSSRHDLSREGFVAKVWQWKAESGDTITRQLRRLGASPDWARERFTMDEGLSAAVRRVFVQLYKQGLIYRDKRLVNWDCKLQTAVSDLEVVQTEINGHLWHFKYPIEGSEDRTITIATTRPETMLGDTAVAVHPDDDRYKDLVGKNAILPIVGRPIPIVADDYADPETGSGAVKITPAHDFNDFEVGRRHGLALVNVLNADGKIVSSELDDFTWRYRAPDEHGVTHADEDGIIGPSTVSQIPQWLRGLDRFEARTRIIAEMERLGLLERTEDHVHTVPHGDRSGTVLEPWLTDQWFVDAKTLAVPAIEAVETGRTEFVPRHWQNTYFEWMRNIQPWCISRQIWWGHQIPAWYGPDDTIFVEETEDEAEAAAAKHYGTAMPLKRDEDVLDTWFSSALWPFSTLGWPDQTPELKRYYPTDVLVTGFDIIFFWVARMMMMGLHFMGEVPFHTVYIHALVRDLHGHKMSKSKGNIIDPLELIDRFGCDALRFTLAALATQGRDIKLDESRVEGYRNFATKLWNAARFCQINDCRPRPGFDPAANRETMNRWIAGGIAGLGEQVSKAIGAYRFNDAAGALYRFTWGTFCDWYLEFIKPALTGPDGAVKDETRATAAWALDQLLHMLHPFMPFITEELWEQMAAKRENRLISASWPDFGAELTDDAAETEMDWVVRLVSLIRGVRAEMNVPAAAKIPMLLKDADAASLEWLKIHRERILTLARLDAAEALDAGGVPEGSVQMVLDEATVILPLAGVIDIAQEKDRLGKEIGKMAGEIGKIETKLGNAQFVARAPAEVVEENRERLAEAEASRAKLEQALDRLTAM